jgi:hypothetical protein
MKVFNGGSSSGFYMTPFPFHKRKAFSGLALVIVRSYISKPGPIKVRAKSQALYDALVEVDIN